MKQLLSNPWQIRAVLFFLVILWAGTLTLTHSFPDPTALKTPVMLLGMLGIVLSNLGKFQLSRALIPFLLFWLCAYFNLSQAIHSQETALTLLAMLLAFLLGYQRTPLFHPGLTPPLILLCVGAGIYSLVTLSPEAPFFDDKNVYGGMLVLGALYHFYLMESGGPNKPVQVLLYSSTLVVLVSILLVDSRIAQGAFFLSFLPLLFVTVRLDGKEPKLEKLAWTMGMALCLGLAWINLPDNRFHQLGLALSPSSPSFIGAPWLAGWDAFRTAPVFGSGTGNFRFTFLEHATLWPFSSGNGMLPIALHAQNHYLETLVEGGILGFGLELILFFGALFGLARVYFVDSYLAAKYVFFALVSLFIMSLFSSILESAPTKAAFWICVGYGWSFNARGRPSPRYASILLGAAILILSILHLYLRIPELRSDRILALAIPLADTNPKSYTNRLTEAMRINPRNESANYRYAEVLGKFHREKDAVNWVEFIQTFAPDSNLRSIYLSKIYFTLAHYDSAAKYASHKLERRLADLPNLEILIRSWKHQGNCQSIDSLQAALATLPQAYRIPATREYTVEGLNNLFRSNREILFLQRWFGGQGLRRAFIEGRLLAYNRQFENHRRLNKLLQTPCSDSLQMAPPPSESPDRPLWKFRGWGIQATPIKWQFKGVYLPFG